MSAQCRQFRLGVSRSYKGNCVSAMLTKSTKSAKSVVSAEGSVRAMTVNCVSDLSTMSAVSARWSLRVMTLSAVGGSVRDMVACVLALSAMSAVYVGGVSDGTEGCVGK